MRTIIDKCGYTLLFILIIIVAIFVGAVRYHSTKDLYAPKSRYQRCLAAAEKMRHPLETEEYTRYVCNRLPVEIEDLN